jgi:hypothetical protein
MNQIDDSNFSLFAAKFYDNPNCTDILEFHDDLNRIKYIKRLLKNYSETGNVKERLILNHFTTLYNVFETSACTKMVVFKLHDHLPAVKSFLMYLNFWPTQITGLGFNGDIIYDKDIVSDPYIDSVLNKI